MECRDCNTTFNEMRDIFYKCKCCHVFICSYCLYDLDLDIGDRRGFRYVDSCTECSPEMAV